MGIAVEIIERLKEIVGANYCSNEPYVLQCYAKSVDPCIAGCRPPWW